MVTPLAGFRVPMIWLIFGSGVKRPDDLDLLTLELVQNISRCTDNLITYFRVSATFLCRVVGKDASN